MFDQSLFKKLQFDRVKRGVIAKAVGDFSKEKLENMPIESNLASIRVKQQETKEARIIIESGQYIPLLGLKQINRLMNKIDKGVILTPAELIEFADFLRSNRMLKNSLKRIGTRRQPCISTARRYLNSRLPKSTFTKRLMIMKY